MFCEKCGFKNDLDSIFCEECGHNLNDSLENEPSSTSKLQNKSVKEKKKKVKKTPLLKQKRLINKHKYSIIAIISVVIIISGIFVGVKYFKDKNSIANKVLVHAFVNDKKSNDIEEYLNVIKDNETKIITYPVLNNKKNMKLYKDTQKYIVGDINTDNLPSVIVGNKIFFGINSDNKKAIEVEIEAIKNSGKVIDVVQNIIEGKEKKYQREISFKNKDNDSNQKQPQNEKNDKETVRTALNNFINLKSYKAKKVLESTMVGNDFNSTNVFNISVDKEHKKYYYTMSETNGNILYYYYVDHPTHIYSKNSNSEIWYYDINWLKDSDPDYIFSNLIPLLLDTDNITLVSNKNNIKTYDIVVPKKNLTKMDIDLSYHVTIKFKPVSDLKATIKISNDNLIYIDYEVSNLILMENIEFERMYKNYRETITFSDFNNVDVIIPNEIVKNAKKSCDFFEEDCE